MTIDSKKDTRKPSISAAATLIDTPVNPREAQRTATLPALKGQIASTLKGTAPATTSSERDPAFQKMMATTVQGQSAEAEATADYNQWRQIELIKALFDDNNDDINTPVETWVAQNRESLGPDFDPKNPIDRAYAEFRRTNREDTGITARYESEQLSHYYYNPRMPSQAGHDRSSRFSVADDGFKPPQFKLSANEARTQLASDIKTVSKMYAADAGMSEVDFAKVIGGIATIESRFGVARDVKGTKYPSSAGGAFHYLDGTIAGEVRNALKTDPRVSRQVAALGVNTQDGISKSEAWTLKDNNVLAGSILARHIVETVRLHPELKNDVAGLATRVYQSHNMGEAGANALARGGLNAVNAIDSRIADNNPMFFKGADSAHEVHARYNKFVAGAVASAAPMIDTAFGADTTLAAAAPSKKPPVLAAAAPAPQPS